MVRTRFAPSPTGFLHVGNIRTAIITWLYARNKGGEFLLRIDDTDKTRSEQKYVDQIKKDLIWLGIDWDTIFSQSTRMNKYMKIKQLLIDKGRLYPCYETEEELMIKRKNLLSRNLPPIYDRASLNLKDEEKKQLENKGIKPYWRFLLNDEKISWNDGVRGPINFDPKKLTDPILIRTDGTLTYSLASVVDDIDYEITDIIRGEDHISNSAIHFQLFKALSSAPPNFSHISLMQHSGGKISKREGSFKITDIKNKGILPKSLAIYLSKIGTSENIKLYRNQQELIESFSLNSLGRASVKFNIEELEKFNTKVMHKANYKDIESALEKTDLKISETLWNLIKNNVSTINEIEFWIKILDKNLNTKTSDKELIKISYEELPYNEINENFWNDWISKIKKRTYKRGKALFLPLRLALTGLEYGPEIEKIIKIIGFDLLKKRIENLL